ncbi:hypothetical protein [Thioalkalivibrio sp. ALM2T]|uniref:hypothetical protein n=1 Tax=Thioalkalivibrio sp. ALM2T TaxID=1158184 RepID=UPI000361171F|nr:hypothetical protein [Thioalkalivibrio sp. ALM2T]
MKLIALVLFALIMTGCATTNTETHVDPDHQGKSYSKIMIDMPNADFEFRKLVTDELCKGLSEKAVSCATRDELLPPTREYTEAQIFQAIEDHEIDGWLVVGIGEGESDSQYIGSQQFGSATVYGNTVYGRSSSIPMRSFSRQQGYSLRLFDMDTKGTAFVMDASTSASGMANVTNPVFARSLARTIIDEMSTAGFIE